MWQGDIWDVNCVANNIGVLHFVGAMKWEKQVERVVYLTSSIWTWRHLCEAATIREGHGSIRLICVFPSEKRCKVMSVADLSGKKKRERKKKMMV